jgi:hypothetical protein
VFGEEGTSHPPPREGRRHAPWSSPQMRFRTGPARVRASSVCRRTPNEFASANMLSWPGLAGFQRTDTRNTRGTISLSSSSCFPTISEARRDSPVTFPPGRARLVTNPRATESPRFVTTTGIVRVACSTAATFCADGTTITSTLGRTRPAARSGSRSYFPSDDRWLDGDVLAFHVAEFSQPWMNAPQRRIPSGSVTGTFPRIPIRKTLPGCPSAASGAARMLRAMVERNLRRVLSCRAAGAHHRRCPMIEGSRRTV